MSFKVVNKEDYIFGRQTVVCEFGGRKLLKKNLVYKN